MEALKGEITCF